MLSKLDGKSSSLESSSHADHNGGINSVNNQFGAS